jgi:hypothetical protein
MREVWFHGSCAGGYSKEEISDLKAIEILRTLIHCIKQNNPDSWAYDKGVEKLIGAMSYLQAKVWDLLPL